MMADFSRVLVVGRSRINLVVVSKIVERSGMRPISETPEMASKTLKTLVPCAVVLDGGADNRDCDALLSDLEAMRRASGNKPSVILLSTKTGADGDMEVSSVIDAVVAKPITPELLQPVLSRLAGQHR
ncbi:transcriptional regulator [Mesorhizobium sp. Root554]|nr:hypothetical protein [Mesorhizobium sp. Root554]KQZ15685.1 transcriptional regulator [Mesorhizobium sp. Root1471]KQZ38193.1 transcriptional regulator [Mesorhizobium sp. Root554]